MCSPITARLLVRRLGVSADSVRPLQPNCRTDVHGVGVTLLDANHCPGAVMILFEVPGRRRGTPFPGRRGVDGGEQLLF